MFDCDGFSIQGEQARFPAEFVSEEYIYPEGMAQSCEDMGEEQDKFALAVIIFKLLNNGIHPFSGVAKKNADSALSIQERIERYVGRQLSGTASVQYSRVFAAEHDEAV